MTKKTLFITFNALFFNVFLMPWMLHQQVAQKETRRMIFHEFSLEVKGGWSRYHIILYMLIPLFYTSVSVYKWTLGEKKKYSFKIKYTIYRCGGENHLLLTVKRMEIFMSVCGAKAWIRLKTNCFWTGTAVQTKLCACMGSTYTCCPTVFISAHIPNPVFVFFVFFVLLSSSVTDPESITEVFRWSCCFSPVILCRVRPPSSSWTELLV